MVLQGPGRVLQDCELCSRGSVVPGDVSHPQPHCATVRVVLGDVCGSGVPRMCSCVASDAGAAACVQWGWLCLSGWLIPGLGLGSEAQRCGR